jgi:hypothetical protein
VSLGFRSLRILRISRREIPLSLWHSPFLIPRLLAKSLRPLVEYRIGALLAPYSYAKVKFLRTTMHMLHQSLCTPCKGKSYVLSLLSFGIKTYPVDAILALCVHTLHHSIEEKQLKLILTFIVSPTHNEIHSFTHQNTNIESCKQFSHTIHWINFPLLYSSVKNGCNCDFSIKKLKLRFSTNSYPTDY